MEALRQFIETRYKKYGYAVELAKIAWNVHYKLCTLNAYKETKNARRTKFFPLRVNQA